jgi:hypothetical protein
MVSTSFLQVPKDMSDHSLASSGEELQVVRSMNILRELMKTPRPALSKVAHQKLQVAPTQGTSMSANSRNPGRKDCHTYQKVP